MAHTRSNRRQRTLIGLIVRSGSSTTGVLRIGAVHMPCTLGRSGIAARKREGDGATPRGVWPLTFGYYRADRSGRPPASIAWRATRPDDAWCDVPGDGNYNRPVRLPYPVIDECLWRADGLYDICVVLGHNRRPRIQWGGSAIFLHVMRGPGVPTAGCIAVRWEDLRRLLALTGQRSAIAAPIGAARRPTPRRG